MKTARGFMVFSCTCGLLCLRCAGRYGKAVVSKRLSLVLCLIALAALCPLVAAKNSWKNPANYAGQFNVIVRGYWHGQGVATVTASTVQINANVTDDDGNTGTLTTDALPLKENHFFGQGTVLGVAMTIDGRAEPQDQPGGSGKGKGKGKKSSDQAVTTNANLEASVTTQVNGVKHTGRVVGVRNGTGS
jgi:hypothetical protein